MTVRYVACDFCHRIHDFHVMHMCPLCRRTICRACKHPGPPRPGHCLHKHPCEGTTNPPPPPPQ